VVVPPLLALPVLALPLDMGPVADAALVTAFVLVTALLVLVLPMVEPLVVWLPETFAVEPDAVGPLAVWVPPTAPDVASLFVELPQAVVETRRPMSDNECFMLVSYSHNAR
jgi:hypothetical protein